tara:strand:+ start:2616 stop:2756 length:141 start_codon:yes stop_codon:yes gene_type:complete
MFAIGSLIGAAPVIAPAISVGTKIRDAKRSGTKETSKGSPVGEKLK